MKVRHTLFAAMLVFAAIPAQAVSYTYSPFTAPGATATAAQGNNKNGEVTGWFQNSAGTHGFLKSGSTYSVIDYPGSTYTIVRGINDNKQVVGYSTVPFKWTGGTFSTITIAGSSWIGPVGVNNASTVSGQYSTTDGLYHGFIQSPTSTTVVQLNDPLGKPGPTSAGGTN